jgi:hypothetical protein
LTAALSGALQHAGKRALQRSENLHPLIAQLYFQAFLFLPANEIYPYFSWVLGRFDEFSHRLSLGIGGPGLETCPFGSDLIAVCCFLIFE